MRTKPLIASLLLVGFAVAFGQKALPSEYADLLSRLKGGDTTIDFKKLRLSWVDSPEHQKAQGTDEQKKSMFAAIDSNKHEQAIKNAEAVLANEYLDVDAHFVEYIALRELHHDDLAAFHRAVVTGLLKSITGSADGKTRGTAFVVIDTNEEYVLLRFMGLVLGLQTLRQAGGHWYDETEVSNPQTGEKQTLYFNVDIPMQHYGV